MAGTKTILIIGNGFDLAHGLPTRYSDFLDFCRVFPKIYEPDMTRKGLESELESWKGNNEVKNILRKLFDSREKEPDYHCNIDLDYDRLENLLKNNIWLEYFSKQYASNQMKGKNWIDLESEISHIIRWIDDNNDGMDCEFNSKNVSIPYSDDNKFKETLI